MDIVDINKVLDDLELNEEEQHSKLSKPAAVSDENRSNTQQQNDLYSPYKYPTSSSQSTIIRPSNAVATNVPVTMAMPPIANRMTKTNFVKVSNVFNR